MLRARNPRAKADRHAEILHALAEQLDRTPNLADLAMHEVARTAGLGKSTLYGYAATKEELLLDLLRRELDGWLGEVVPAVVPGADVAAVLAASLQVRPRTLRLLALAPTLIETNVGEAAAVAWKTWLLDRLAPLAAALVEAIPAADGLRVALHLHAVLVGVYAVAVPGPVVAAALARPELATLAPPLEPTLRLLFAAVIDAARTDIPLREDHP